MAAFACLGFDPASEEGFAAVVEDVGVVVVSVVEDFVVVVVVVAAHHCFAVAVGFVLVVAAVVDFVHFAAAESSVHCLLDYCFVLEDFVRFAGFGLVLVVLFS